MNNSQIFLICYNFCFKHKIGASPWAGDTGKSVIVAVVHKFSGLCLTPLIALLWEFPWKLNFNYITWSPLYLPLPLASMVQAVLEFINHAEHQFLALTQPGLLESRTFPHVSYIVIPVVQTWPLSLQLYSTLSEYLKPPPPIIYLYVRYI